MVFVVGAPTLVRLSLCSWSKALHSGPQSIKLSSKTKPQYAQVTSALPLSILRSVELQSGQGSTSSSMKISLGLKSFE